MNSPNKLTILAAGFYALSDKAGIFSTLAQDRKDIFTGLADKLCSFTHGCALSDIPVKQCVDFVSEYLDANSITDVKADKVIDIFVNVSSVL